MKLFFGEYRAKSASTLDDQSFKKADTTREVALGGHGLVFKSLPHNPDF